MTTPKTTQEIRSTVREHYGQIAASFKPSTQASCCSPTSETRSGCCDPVPAEKLLGIYEIPDAADLPEEVTGLSLGCGDPITLASLQPGQTVLDLGSGGGIDCFLAARKVGPEGRVIGVDMTPEMLEKARANREKLGAKNVEFRLGEIEHLPVADNTVDVIISNCVINLSPDKAQVFKEAYRVLRPQGKLSISDIVTNGPLPEALKASLSAWAGCVAGALEVQEYVDTIKAAGFEDVQINPVYLPKEMVDQAVDQMEITDEVSRLPEQDVYEAVFSAKITARKPG